MKKLSVILLATVFVFGLAVQANAQVTDGVDQSASAGDQVITFDEFAADIGCPEEFEITEQYWDEFGVQFLGGLYGDESFSPFYMADTNTASNFNSCNFFPEINIPGEPVMVTFDKPVTHVGFDGHSPEGKITVTAFRDGVAMVSVTKETGGVTFISIEDTEGIEEIKIEGDGMLYGTKPSVFFIDNLTFGGTPATVPTDIEVRVNIKPPNCLDARIPFNVKSKGVTPVVIIGDGSYDVSEINPETVLLQGVEPDRYAIENASHCNAVEGDGVLDLTLKFDTEKLVDGIKNSLDEGDTLEDGKSVFLNLTGNLFDGTPIKDDGGLFVTIIMKGKHEKNNNGKGNKQSFDPHSRHDRGHHRGWHNNRGHHKGWDNHR